MLKWIWVENSFCFELLKLFWIPNHWTLWNSNEWKWSFISVLKNYYNFLILIFLKRCVKVLGKSDPFVLIPQLSRFLKNFNPTQVRMDPKKCKSIFDEKNYPKKIHNLFVWIWDSSYDYSLLFFSFSSFHVSKAHRYLLWK